MKFNKQEIIITLVDSSHEMDIGFIPGIFAQL